MNGHRLMIRLVGAFTCVAAVAAGWDAEAARCHRRRACCYETCCPSTVSCATTNCCPTACTSCAPAYEQVCWSHRDPCTNCCVRTCGYRVIESGCCVASAPACCEEVVIASSGPSAPTIAGSARPAVTTVSARR